MELHHIQVVGVHAAQALLDAGADVLGRKHVRVAFTGRGWRRAA